MQVKTYDVVYDDSIRCRTSDLRRRINIRHRMVAMSYVLRHRRGTMSYVHDVRHRISMSYVRYVRHRNIRCRSTYDIAIIRCRMFIRRRRSDVRHRMLSSYTTSYVLTCISYADAYNIAYDIAYDIVCDVHSIGFRAEFRGFNWHARSRWHRSLHGSVFIQDLSAPPAAGDPAPSLLLSAGAAGAAAAGVAAFPSAGAADSSSPSSSPDNS